MEGQIVAESLAYIGKIVNKSPIEKADKLESIEVVCGKGGKWNAVSTIGNFQVGNLCEVYLQDSIVPSNERFSFLEKYHYRIKMQRLRGAISECLCMPLSLTGVNLGDDITDVIGVRKYQKPLPANIQGDIKGHFPNFLKKTDEPNFQRSEHLLKALRGQPFYSTVKYDGSSVTYYKYKSEFGCCSRNYELKYTENNSIWSLAKEYDIEKLLPEGFAIQAEIVGPGIQGNPLKLAEPDIYVFNVYDIVNRKYVNLFDARIMVANLKWVETIDCGEMFNMNHEQLISYAEGKYSSGIDREGIVIRPLEEQMVDGERLSFKVINLLYKN